MRQTERRTDGRNCCTTIALWIDSYADARYRSAFRRFQTFISECNSNCIVHVFVQTCMMTATTQHRQLSDKSAMSPVYKYEYSLYVLLSTSSLFIVFTARCTRPTVQSAVLRSHVVCPSVRLSVTLMDCDDIGWNSSKIISRLVSMRCSLSADPNITGLLHE